MVDSLAGVGGGRGVGDGTGVIHVGDVASDFRLAVSALLVGGGRIGVDTVGACDWFIVRLLLRLTGISCWSSTSCVRARLRIRRNVPSLLIMLRRRPRAIRPIDHGLRLVLGIFRRRQVLSLCNAQVITLLVVDGGVCVSVLLGRAVMLDARLLHVAIGIAIWGRVTGARAGVGSSAGSRRGILTTPRTTVIIPAGNAGGGRPSGFVGFHGEGRRGSDGRMEGFPLLLRDTRQLTRTESIMLGLLLSLVGAVRIGSIHVTRLTEAAVGGCTSGWTGM